MKKLVRQWVLLGFAVLAWWWGGVGYLSRLLQAERELLVRQLVLPATHHLVKAHRAKDDLALQEAVQALAQAPGVSWTCVTDPKRTVLAHSRPEELGRSLGSVHAPSPVIAIPLAETRESWGTLLFPLSMKGFYAIRHRSMLIMGVGGLIVFLAWGLHAMQDRRRDLRLDTQLADLNTSLIEERKQSSRHAATCDAMEKIWWLWFQEAVDQIPSPRIFLDSRQRVVALSLAATSFFPALAASQVIGRFWHDVPLLQDCGPMIARALERPGLPVETGPFPSGIRLTFLTAASADTFKAGMWVFLSKM